MKQRGFSGEIDMSDGHGRDFTLGRLHPQLSDIRPLGDKRIGME